MQIQKDALYTRLRRVSQLVQCLYSEQLCAPCKAQLSAMLSRSHAAAQKTLCSHGPISKTFTSPSGAVISQAYVESICNPTVPTPSRCSALISGECLHWLTLSHSFPGHFFLFPYRFSEEFLLVGGPGQQPPHFLLSFVQNSVSWQAYFQH